jgi:hypothetical protein
MMMIVKPIEPVEVLGGADAVVAWLLLLSTPRFLVVSDDEEWQKQVFIIMVEESVVHTLSYVCTENVRSKRDSKFEKKLSIRVLDLDIVHHRTDAQARF